MFRRVLLLFVELGEQDSSCFSRTSNTSCLNRSDLTDLQQSILHIRLLVELSKWINEFIGQTDIADSCKSINSFDRSLEG